MSLEGTIAGVLGSIIIAVYAYFVGLITPLGAGMCLLAAFIATNIESLIGATAQGKVLWLTNEVCCTNSKLCVDVRESVV